MSGKKSHISLAWPSGWSLGAALIALCVLAPLLAVVWIAFHPTENIWGHLMSTVLPRYLLTSSVLALSVAALAGAIGAGAAWLIVMYRFPLSRLLEWLMLFPLAIPAYIGAYALVDFLEYAGPVQTGLRALMGWENAQDYWFPEIRSLASAIIVLALALMPYVYLLARAAFKEQSGSVFESAKALGAGPFNVFFRIALPLARPSIAAGMAIVMMETLSDFGTVSYFAVNTLTTGIFTTWLEARNAGGAAQLSLLVLTLVFLLLAFEKTSRGRAKFYAPARQSRPSQPRQLTGWRGLLATFLCLLPFLIGFGLPVGVIAHHALGVPEAWFDRGLISALLNTVFVSGSAALITLLLAIFLVYGVRLSPSPWPRRFLPATTLGYAAPGAVLGIGILIPLASLDHALADTILALTGYDPGLLLTGTGFAIILAFTVRFFAISQGAVDAAMGRVAPELPLAARSLGQTSRATLARVYLPLIKGSLGTALLLVFVDCVKELPATLLLRPFNFNTLATRTYENASLEQLEAASPAALLVILMGLIAVLILARAQVFDRK